MRTLSFRSVRLFMLYTRLRTTVCVTSVLKHKSVCSTSSAVLFTRDKIIYFITGSEKILYRRTVLTFVVTRSKEIDESGVSFVSAKFFTAIVTRLNENNDFPIIPFVALKLLSVIVDWRRLFVGTTIAETRHGLREKVISLNPATFCNAMVLSNLLLFQQQDIRKWIVVQCVHEHTHNARAQNICIYPRTMRFYIHK